MKQIVSFLMICLYVLGAIGGVGYAAYNHAWAIVIGVIGLAYMAWPTLYINIQNLTK